MSNYWVVQEGILGDITNKISEPTAAQALDVTWHVVGPAATKPNASAKGPYPSQSAAQAQADTLNGKGAGSASGSVVGQAASSAADTFKGLNLGNWVLRVGEIILGVVLIGVGIAKLTGAENVVSGAIKKGVPLP